MGRSFKTAEIIREKSGHEVITDSSLRERNLGIIQGLTRKDFKMQYPEIHERLELNDPDFIISGGESIRQCYQRTISCLNEIAQGHPGEI